MERDANQLLNKGYSVNEILATILHSVMENYLKKVAVEGSIGHHIVFRAPRQRTDPWSQLLNKDLEKRSSYHPIVILRSPGCSAPAWGGQTC